VRNSECQAARTCPITSVFDSERRVASYWSKITSRHVTKFVILKRGDPWRLSSKSPSARHIHGDESSDLSMVSLEMFISVQISRWDFPSSTSLRGGGRLKRCEAQGFLPNPDLPGLDYPNCCQTCCLLLFGDTHCFREVSGIRLDDSWAAEERSTRHVTA